MTTLSDLPAQPTTHGEGNYDAGRRHRRALQDFLLWHDVEALARRAAPASPAEAAGLLAAEDAGRARARR